MLKSYINEIDKRLVNEYNNPLKRDDYLSFLKWFNTRITNGNENKEFFFDYHNERKKWGRPIINNKRVYKLAHMIDTLIKHNVIFRSGYKFGENSRARTYQYAVDFLDIIEITDESIDIVLDESKSKYILKILPNNNQYQLLVSDRFTINRFEAMKWVIEETSHNRISKEKALKYHTVIDDIYYKNIFTSIGEKSGRLFTSFTSLNHNLREFCSIDNKYLSSIDLKSSQIYFLLNLMKQQYDDMDILRLYEIVISGDIYDYINNQMKCFKNREETKLEFYHFLYKGNKGYLPMQSFFKVKFPGFYNALIDLNKKLSKQNTNLSIELQRIEADIFITVCDKFVMRGCLSVHDSLYYVKDIEGELIDELMKQFNEKGYSKFKLNTI